jgi:hypothetical protein
LPVLSCGCFRRRWRGATIHVCSTWRLLLFSLIHEIPWWLCWFMDDTPACCVAFRRLFLRAYLDFPCCT